MNRAAFFTSLRKRSSGVFGTSLSQKQVASLDAILDYGSHLPITHLAYAMATAYHETNMVYDLTENMNYSAGRIPQVFGSHRLGGKSPRQLAGNPELMANIVYGGEWGRENLGNTQPGDGFKFRGHSLPQFTGRGNFVKLARLIGVDVVSNPGLTLTPEVGARGLVAAIEHGIFTGRKASDYLPGDYVNARRIINADVSANGATIAGYARAFEAALIAGGYTPGREVYPAPPTSPRAPITPERPAQRPTGLAALLSRLFAFLSKGGPK